MTYTWIRATNSQVISNTPANIGGVILSSDAVGNADITLYDGSSDQDPQLLVVRAAQFQTKTINFQPYLVTYRGLYCKIGSNVSEAVFQLAVQKE